MKNFLTGLLRSGIFLQIELSKIWAVRSGLKLVQPGVKLDNLAYRNWTASWNWYTELSDTLYIWATLLDADGNVKVKFVYTIRRILDGSPSPGTTILFLGSFEVDEALETMNFNMILRFLEEFKSFVKLFFFECWYFIDFNRVLSGLKM